jgi:hypothetical protein
MGDMHADIKCFGWFDLDTPGAKSNTDIDTQFTSPEIWGDGGLISVFHRLNYSCVVTL